MYDVAELSAEHSCLNYGLDWGKIATIHALFVVDFLYYRCGSNADTTCFPPVDKDMRKRHIFLWR